MNNLILFVKPYLSLSTEDIIKKVKDFGISKIEYPVRNNHFINFENCEKELPLIKETFYSKGIEIVSVASGIDMRIYSAADKADIRFIRIMLSMKKDETFNEARERFIQELTQCAKYGERFNVTTLIQPHNGRYVANLSELQRILSEVDSKYVKAIWDIGHSGLAGEIPEKCVEEIYDNLEMVNLKSAYFERNKNEDGTVSYSPYYTVGKHSPLNWIECVDLLKRKGYKGLYCTHAEYTDPEVPGNYTGADNTDRYLKEDLEYIKNIIGDVC